MYSVACTIYNLKHNKQLEKDNYEYLIDHKLMEVKKIIFLEERYDVPFSEITAKILYLHFCP